MTDFERSAFEGERTSFERRAFAESTTTRSLSSRAPFGRVSDQSPAT